MKTRGGCLCDGCTVAKRSMSFVLDLLGIWCGAPLMFPIFYSNVNVTSVQPIVAWRNLLAKETYGVSSLFRKFSQQEVMNLPKTSWTWFYVFKEI